MELNHNNNDFHSKKDNINIIIHDVNDWFESTVISTWRNLDNTKKKNCICSDTRSCSKRNETIIG